MHVRSSPRLRKYLVLCWPLPFHGSDDMLPYTIRATSTQSTHTLLLKRLLQSVLLELLRAFLLFLFPLRIGVAHVAIGSFREEYEVTS